MKMKNYIAAVLLLITPFLYGCSDSDNLPFEGTDNHFTSFVLTTSDGAVFKASINGRNLTVKVPENLSLDGAKVQYTLCEQAKVLPDPAEIEDWNEEQVFRLMSYNGTVSNCKYTVLRQPMGSGESISLANQPEVDAFGARNLSVIEGNLIIGSTEIEDDPVANTAPLKSIKKVKGSVIILPSFMGSDLSGLCNLQSAGSIMIGTMENAILTTTAIDINLPELMATGDVILNCNNAKKLLLPKLRNVSKIFINSTQLEEIDITALHHVTGNLEIGKTNDDNGNLEKIELPELVSVEGNLNLQYFSELKKLTLPKLANISGILNIVNLPEIDAFDVPELSHIGGTAFVSVVNAKTIRMPKLENVKALTVTSRKGNTGTDSEAKLIDLSALKRVETNLEISNKALDLESFSLPNLEEVGGNLTISNLVAISDLKLPKLVKAEKITCSRLNELKKFDFPALVEVKTISLDGGSVTEFAYPSLKKIETLTLTGMNSMETMTVPSTTAKRFDGNLTISGCKNLKKVVLPETVAGFLDLTMTGGTIPLPEISSPSGSLVTVENDFKGTVNTKSYEIKGLGIVKGSLVLKAYSATQQNLGSIEELGTYSMSYSSEIEKISAPNLKKVINGFTLSGMTALKEIDFPKLTEVGGAFVMSGNNWNKTEKLTTLNGFKVLEKAASVEVRYQTNLKDFSPLRKVADRITDDSKWVTSNNAYNPTLADMKAGKYTE